MEKGWNKGFTLIESLFVLSIFMLMAMITIIMMKPQTNLLNRSTFFSQLKADIFYAQQYAISNQKQLSLNILPNQYKYYIKNQDGSYLLEREYARNIDISEGTLGLYLKFNPNGNVNKFGSIMIYIGKETYRMIFQIGGGRFYVVKE
ncbi:competence type IV pilus minor pilin ComGD [Cytobacillus sp. Hz8]|uniref:competence type IV pilus minor pilin ComGD n=1 Tax=Cytobacillus sp. Hz8 TaxID=3347168 RepID=UPI0035DC4798